MDTSALKDLVVQVVYLVAVFLVGLVTLEVKRYLPVFAQWLQAQATTQNEKVVLSVMHEAYDYAEQQGYLAKLKQAVLDKKPVALAYAQAEFNRIGLPINATDLEAKLEAIWASNNWDKVNPIIPTRATISS